MMKNSMGAIYPLDLGVNFFDTADVYSVRQSEPILIYQFFMEASHV